METPAQCQTVFGMLINLEVYQIDLRRIESYYRACHEKRFTLTAYDYLIMESYANRIYSKHTYKFDILPNALKEIAAKSFDLIDCSKYLGVEILLKRHH